MASGIVFWDCLIRVTGRHAVGDDDGDVLGIGPVAVSWSELDVVHDADAARRVHVSAQVIDPTDRRLQRVLVRVLVQMEHALCGRR